MGGFPPAPAPRPSRCIPHSPSRRFPEGQSPGNFFPPYSPAFIHISLKFSFFWPFAPPPPTPGKCVGKGGNARWPRDCSFPRQAPDSGSSRGRTTTKEQRHDGFHHCRIHLWDSAFHRLFRPFVCRFRRVCPGGRLAETLVEKMAIVFSRTVSQIDVGKLPGPGSGLTGAVGAA